MKIVSFRYILTNMQRVPLRSIGLTCIFILLTSCFLLLASPIAPAYAEDVISSLSPLDNGIKLLNEKRFDEALKAFEIAISSAPNDPLPHYYSGVAWHLKRQALPAMNALNKALQLRPGMPLAIMRIGMILEDLGRLDKAREAYREAAGNKEDAAIAKEAAVRMLKIDVAIHTQKSRKFFQEKQYDASIKELESVISLRPDNADALYSMGLSFQRLGKLNEAIGVFKKASEINPLHADTHFQLGMTFYSQSAFEEAITSLKKFISISPDSPKVKDAEKTIIDSENRMKTRRLFETSAELIRKEQWKEALKDTQAIVAIEPKNPNALFNLGLTLHKLEESEQAIEALKMAIELDPKLIKAHQQLGVVYDDSGRYREAIEAYNKVLSITETGAEADKARERKDALMELVSGEEKAQTAKELLEKEDVTGAIREIESLLSMKGDDPKLLFTLSTLYVRIGRPRVAASSLEKAILLEPKNADFSYLLAQIYDGLKDLDRAAKIYDIVYSLEEGTARGLESKNKAKELRLRRNFINAKKFIETEKYDDALKEINAVLDISPNDALALFNKGVLYERLNQSNEAEEILREAIVIDPDYIPAHLQLALILEKLRKFDDAKKEFEEIIRLKPDSKESRMAMSRLAVLKESMAMIAYLDKGIKLLEEKKWEEARKEFEAIIAINPKNYIGYFYLGLALKGLGINDEVKSALKKTIEINPRYAPAHLRLADLYLEEGEYERARDTYADIIALGEEVPEADIASARLKRLRPWHGALSVSHNVSSNIAFRQKAQSDVQASYDLDLNLSLLRKRGFNITAGLSGGENIYYKTQFEGNSYALSINGYYELPGNSTVSGNISNSKSYFNARPTYTESRLSCSYNITPMAIPTSTSLRYSGSRGFSYTNKVSNAEKHSLSLSLSQKLSVRDTVSGSYSFSIYKNLDLIGSNYANRTHSFSMSYGRPILPWLGGSLGYSGSYVYYSNPDSTSYFQEFRRNFNQSMNAGLSISVSEKVNFSFGYNFAYAINRTSLPPLTAEEQRKLEDVLAAPIPTVGGGGGYYAHSVNISLSYPF